MKAAVQAFLIGLWSSTVSFTGPFAGLCDFSGLLGSKSFTPAFSREFTVPNGAGGFLKFTVASKEPLVFLESAEKEAIPV
jgi:hypothetical protein